MCAQDTQPCFPAVCRVFELFVGGHSGASFRTIWPVYSDRRRSIDKPNHFVVAFRHRRCSACPVNVVVVLETFPDLFTPPRTRTHDVHFCVHRPRRHYGRRLPDSYVFFLLASRSVFVRPFVCTTETVRRARSPGGGDPKPSHDPRGYPTPPPPHMRSARFRYVRPGLGFQTDYRPDTCACVVVPQRVMVHLGFRASAVVAFTGPPVSWRSTE